MDSPHTKNGHCSVNTSDTVQATEIVWTDGRTGKRVNGWRDGWIGGEIESGMPPTFSEGNKNIYFAAFSFQYILDMSTVPSVVFIKFYILFSLNIRGSSLS